MPTIWQFKLEGACSSGTLGIPQRPAQGLVLRKGSGEQHGGRLGRTFSGSKGTETWGILGPGAGIEMSGEIKPAKGLHAEGKRGPWRD